MVEANSQLVEKVDRLGGFVYGVHSIKDIKSCLDVITEENRIGYLNFKGPFDKIKKAAKELESLVEKQWELNDQYERIMLLGNYDPFGGEVFWNKAAAMVRERGGLSENTPVELNEDDIHKAIIQMNKEREEMRGKDFDYNIPLRILIEQTKMLVDVYTKPEYVAMIARANKRVKPTADYPDVPKKLKHNELAIRKYQENSMAFIRNILWENLIPYYKKFNQKLEELLADYPGEELNEIKEMVKARTQPE